MRGGKEPGHPRYKIPVGCVQFSILEQFPQSFDSVERLCWCQPGERRVRIVGTARKYPSGKILCKGLVIVTTHGSEFSASTESCS